MDHVEVGGLRIAYERAGQGPPIVFLQGFVADGSGTWAHQIDALSDELTVVVWDSPGCGESSDPPTSFTMADFADCLAGFIEALGLKRPHLVGLSYGGTIALELYHRHPAIPKTLILAGAYAGWSGSLPPEAVQQRLTLSLRAADMPPEQFVDVMLPSMFSESAPKERVQEFGARMAEFHPDGFKTMARATAEADLRAMLSSIDVPTLLLYGDKDVRAPLDVGESLHAAIPSSKFIVLPGVGHVSSVEDPERFNAEVRKFLRSVKNAGR